MPLPKTKAAASVFARRRRQGRRATRSAADLIAMEPTYILAAEIDEESFAQPYELPRLDFSAERNVLPARLTCYFPHYRKLRWASYNGSQCPQRRLIFGSIV